MHGQFTSTRAMAVQSQSECNAMFDYDHPHSIFLYMDGKLQHLDSTTDPDVQGEHASQSSHSPHVRQPLCR